MRITVEEFEKNLDYYLENVGDEEIIITKDGIPISSLVSPEQYEKITGRKININL